jgi:soluble lytic murein transglycosylase
LRELGQIDQSGAAFARIAGETRFYGQLASGELGRRVQLPPRAAPPTAEELAAVAANPGLQRSLALYRLDMRIEGMREWNWAIRGMDDRTLLAAAELARRNEVWDRSINTADRTVVLHDYARRYPAPYAEVLIAQARSHELEEHWVLGLVRQESRFIAGAKSSAGASGLMQLMPATARWTARKIGLRDYSWSRVTDVGVNAALGTAYLKHVLADVDGSPVVAAAGYNAGPSRAHRWRDARPIEGAIYAESIPFNETRDYVKKVMANTVLYSAVLGGSMRTLKERLGVIAPRP